MGQGLRRKQDAADERRTAEQERADKPAFKDLVEERERRNPDSAHVRELVGILRYAPEVEDGEAPPRSPMDQIGHLPFDEVADELAVSVIDTTAQRSTNAARKVALAISTCYSRHPELRVRRANPVRGAGISPPPPGEGPVRYALQVWAAHLDSLTRLPYKE
jgi:hypothetical protein